MRTFLKDVYRIWKLNGISLFLFELIYRVATSAVIIRLTDWFISISLKQQKYSYLTAENFVKFICHPLTLILLAVILLCMAFAVLLEISAVFWCIQCSMLNEKRTCRESLKTESQTASCLSGTIRFSGASTCLERCRFWGCILLSGRSPT